MIPSERLQTREARCICGEKTPSRPDLPHFEYRGAGSYHALQMCANCSYTWSAHRNPLKGARHQVRLACENFKPRGPHDFDAYFCGHLPDGEF